MVKTSEVPILIVGGGAAGSVLALELARHGVEARTIDRLSGPTETSRAITLHSRTAELLERVDQRLIDRLMARNIHNKGYVLHFVDGTGQRSEVRPGMDFTTVNSRYRFMLIHRQSETEDLIRDYVRDVYGRDTEWSTRCVAVSQDADGVTARVVHSDRGDEEELVRCRYLIACDGANSRIREAVGLASQGQAYKGMVLQNMDAFIEGFPDVGDYIHYCAGTDHFVMVARLPGGFYRLLSSDRGNLAAGAQTPKEVLQATLDKHFDGARIADIVWHSTWDHALRLAETYRHGRVFLAGDSAHVHPTTGGQGMNCCMQDAFNLGWKLALVAKGWAGPDLLDTYEKERRPIAEQVLWAATSLQDVFMGHGRDIGERSQKIHDAEWLDAVVGRCSGISYSYRDQAEPAPGLAPMPGPAAGDRAPDADLADGSTIYRHMRHPGFTLLTIEGRDSQESAVAVGRVVKRFAPVMKGRSARPTADLEAQYGADARTRLYLVRPDGYVGFRCLAAEADRMAAHLEALLTVGQEQKSRSLA
jgi:2-polyprenyl-6-methoxyphenol hydroxylase-like FAD-dependent oxidoreductase